MTRVNVTDNTAQVISAIAGARPQALSDAAEHLLGVANQTIPLEEGTMAGSGVVVVDGNQAVVAYTDESGKVLRQHEDLTLRHAPGRRAKWLEAAGQEEAAGILQFIAAAFRGAL